jgi:hypothetical protein
MIAASPPSAPEADMLRHLGFRQEVFRAVGGLEVLGVPVASLLEETLDVDCASGVLREPGDPDWVLRSQQRLLVWHRALQRAARQGAPRARPAGAGRVLIDVASTGDNYRRIWEPLARALGTGGTVLLAPPSAPDSDRLDGFEWTVARRLPWDWEGWRRWVHEGYAGWVERGRSLAASGVGERGALRLAGAIARQGQRVFEAHAALEHHRPRVVLALADRGASGSAIVGAARRRGIPTLTITHCPVGTTFGQTFLPLNADVLLVWGEYQRAAFEGWGLPASRIRVVGYPGVPDARPPDRPTAGRIHAVGLPPRDTYVLAVTGPMKDEWRRRWAEELARAASRSPLTGFLVRVHPSESGAFYRPLFRDLGNVTVLENRALSLSESIGLADRVVVHGSSVGIEALLAGKDLLVLDCLPFTLGTMREVLQAGAAQHVRSGEELAERLHALGRDPGSGEAVRAEGRRFVSGFFAAFGQEACRRVVDELRAVAPTGS